MQNPAIKISTLDYQKLSTKFRVISLNHEYGIYQNNVFYGIRYFNLDTTVEEFYLNHLFPSNLASKFRAFLMLINHDEITPHTDSDIQCVINYYIQSSNAITDFWQHTPHTTSTQLPQQSNGHVYNKDELTKYFSFTARDNDLWLLNVREIHSVSHSKDKRVAICFQTDIPYIEMLNHVETISHNINTLN